ncbi:MAG: tetratricopeptide repeat protein [Ignavibacteriales bacterium]|nr:tetratricopeptide repeat protein [Ignavibacteriales bacterium]
MRRNKIFAIALMAVLIAAVLEGCSASKPAAAKRDVFFRPLVSRRTVVVPSATKPEFDSLKIQVERLSNLLAIVMGQRATPSTSDENWHDIANSLASTNRQLAQRLNVLESRINSGVVERIRPAWIDSLLQENFALRQQVVNMRQHINQLESETQPSAAHAQPTPPPNKETPPVPSAPPDLTVSKTKSVSSMADEYAMGVALFRQRRYDDAQNTFRSLIERGIREDLADNCEYWIGESYYAQRDWHRATDSFLRVIAMRNSNKAPDSYLMMGKSQEQLGNLAKAKSAFETLIHEFPKSDAARTARAKLTESKYQTLRTPSKPSFIL